MWIYEQHSAEPYWKRKKMLARILRDHIYNRSLRRETFHFLWARTASFIMPENTWLHRAASRLSPGSPASPSSPPYPSGQGEMSWQTLDMQYGGSTIIEIRRFLVWQWHDMNGNLSCF